MDRKKYDQMILYRIEGSLDLILPIAAAIALVSAVIILLNDPKSFFLYFDMTVGLVFAAFFLMRHRIPIMLKILLVTFMTTALGVLSLLNSGFTGTGIILLMLSSLIIVGFMPTKYGIYYSVLTTLTIMLVPVALSSGLIEYNRYNANLLNNPLEWMLHVMTYALYGFVLITMVNAIKGYLIKSIGEAEENAEYISTLAYYDRLTGLPNKIRFIEDFYVNRPEQGWLVLLNIRGLNLINSIYGTALGDKVIQRIAEKLLQISDGDEKVAKTGGNEFLWLCYSETQEALLAKLTTLNETMHQYTDSGDLPTKVTFNAGYVKFEEKPKSIGDVIHKAIIALEQAKSSSSSNIMQYDHQLEERFRFEEKVKTNLIKGIDNDEFYISYQEKRDCHADAVIGVEALARWHSPILGNVPPNVFIPIIDKSNLSAIFGMLVINRVLDEYPRLVNKYGEDLSVSINISPMHLASPEFAHQMTNAVELRGIDASRVILEITEDSLIEDIQGASEVLYELRRYGFKISLDDFGTGYSSLSYLARLGIDELKIDRSFVKQMVDDQRTSTLIRTIINLKETYGINIVAEGVETVAQSEELIRLGCNVHQGYLFSRPEPLSRE